MKRFWTISLCLLMSLSAYGGLTKGKFAQWGSVVSVPTTIVDTNIVIDLQFISDNGTNYLDSSVWGNHFNAPLGQNPTWSTNFGGMVTFDNVDDWLGGGNPASANLTNKVTVIWWEKNCNNIDYGCWWAKYNSAGANGMVALIRSYTPYFMDFASYTYTRAIGTQIPTNQAVWNQICCIKDGVTQTTWTNGVLAQTYNNANGDSRSENTSWQIGRYDAGSPRAGFTLSRFMVINTNISATQVTNYWNAQKGRFGY